MGNLVRDALSRWGSPLRLAVARRRDHRAVVEDIASLHPLDSGHPLVRVGGDGDGGYLLPDDLDGVVACFSPGVGESSSFELDLDRRGIACFLADASVDGPPPAARHLDFERAFLGTCDGPALTTLESWMARHPASLSGDCVLQMDIEGSEYGVLLTTPREVLRRFRIIAIELHHVEQLVHPVAGPLMAAAFRRLAEDFVPVHLHANNTGRALRIGPVIYPRLLEVTWIRRDRCRRMLPLAPGRHPLERDNCPSKPSFELGPEWFAEAGGIRAGASRPAPAVPA